MYKSNALNLFINITITVICITSFVFLFINQKNTYQGYELMYLMPLSYLFFHILFIRRVLTNYGLSIFLAVYILVSFTRFVIMPFLTLESGWYLGRSQFSPSPYHFNKAILLMIYELFFYHLTVYLAHRIIFKNHKYNKLLNREKLNFEFNSFIYIIFILFSISMIILKPSVIKYISFISVNSSYMSFREFDTLTSFIILMLTLSRYLLYFIIVKFIVKFIQPKHFILSIILVSIVTMLNGLIFFGTNRADFVFTFIVSLIILIYLYGRYGIALNLVFISLLPFVINRISSYRKQGTITDGEGAMVVLTDNLQIYLGGIYNVAISLDLPERTGNVLLLLADIFRSAIGPNIFLKNLDFITSSQLFNYRIFSTGQVSQIIPMIGQSQLYLGFFFSPLLGMAFITLAVFLTKLLVKYNRFDLVFMLMLISGRLGFVMAQNGNIFLNELTTLIPLFLILYYLNNKIVVKL